MVKIYREEKVVGWGSEEGNLADMEVCLARVMRLPCLEC